MQFARALVALTCSLLMAACARPPATVLLETEAFDDLGGWMLDQQFMDLMGSPYLLAHGIGVPVDDAQTSVTFNAPGEYRVWVRTRDWVAPWNAPGAPGRFQVLIDDVPLATTFGTEGDPWHWQDGGAVTVGARATVALHDLTGFEGRCDAILFCRDLAFVPPHEGDDLAAFRRDALGLPAEPVETDVFDLVVVGGGVAGTAAAVTAARLGLSVALVQDRPVLGGNASSEVRVWPEGHVNQAPWPRVGDVVMEIVPEKKTDSRNAQGAHVFDDDRKLRLVRAEPNVTLFLENRVNGAEATDGHLQAVVSQHVRTAERTRIRGRLFLDSTGDGSVGYLAGADYDVTATGHMGASNLWNITCLCEDEDPLSAELEAACADATFPHCPWAVDLTDHPFPDRERGATAPEATGSQPISLGNWYWENGFDRDPIHDMERIRDQNFRAMYGAWDVIKNVEQRYPAHRLNWVAYIAGKRESRRLLGDVILTAENLRDGDVFEDGCFPCTWGIDTHFPDPAYQPGHEGDEFIAGFTHGEGYTYQGPYWVPYRCLYSRTIDNLFMAGRDISVTHEALGAVRVMKTTGAMGEIVGMAAALCREHDCPPRDVYRQHLGALHDLMRRGAGRAADTNRPDASTRPNIVYILADDLGSGDLSCMNQRSAWQTENIDELAAQGMLMTDAHSGSAVCTPTRYGILTGRYAWRSRLKRGVLGGESLHLINPDRMTVASYLQDHGYDTACIGKWHLGWDWARTPVDDEVGSIDFEKAITHGPSSNGFDEYYCHAASLDMAPYVYVENDRVTSPPDRVTGNQDYQGFWREGLTGADFVHDDVLPNFTRKAVEFIRSRQGQEAPFFLYLPLPAPHTPILPSAAFRGRSGTNVYGDFVLQVDDTVGQVMRAVAESGFGENTIFIFTSDNGCSPRAKFEELAAHGHRPSHVYRGYKADIYEGGHRIPFIARWPGRIEAGSQSDQVVCLTDLLRTCADIVGDPLPDDAGEDSVSLVPILLGQAGTELVREATVHHSINGSFAIRSGQWKLALCPGSGGWSEPRPAKAIELGGPSIQLFDLSNDIGETTNVCDQYPEIVERLTTLLQSYVTNGRSTPGAVQSNEGETQLR